MCARYTMTLDEEALAEAFDAISVLEESSPRYNIAPTAQAPIVVASSSGERRLGLARFGFVPHWAKDLGVGVRMLNARSETVADKSAFRAAFLKRRCLVPADGFYEWMREDGVKSPVRFVLPGEPIFAMAGLWSVWVDPAGQRVPSFTILTRAAEGAVAAVHDRMPVILPPSAHALWLDRSSADRGTLFGLIAEHGGAALTGYRVSRRVNSVRADDAALITPIFGPEIT